MIFESLSNGFAALGERRGPWAPAHYYRYKINDRILNFIDTTSHFSLPPLLALALNSLTWSTKYYVRNIKVKKVSLIQYLKQNKIVLAKFYNIILLIFEIYINIVNDEFLVSSDFRDSFARLISAFVRVAFGTFDQ